MNEVRDRVNDVKKKVFKAIERYEAVETALTRYATALTDAQSNADAALRDAQNAQNAIDLGERHVAAASRALDDAAPDDVSTARGKLRAARDDVHAADARLESARRALEAAVTDRDRAAQTAIDDITAAVESDDLNDGVWQAWAGLAHWVHDNIGKAATVVGVLALVLCWVPVLGQALAVAALLLTAVTLVADILLAINHEGSWTDVILGIVAVASFGLGRVVGMGAKAAVSAARGATRVAATGLRAGGRSTIRSLVGSGIGRLSLKQGKAMAAAGGFRTGAMQGWRALHPKVLWKELADLKTFRWSDVGTGWSALRNGLRSANPLSLFALSQGETAAAQAYAELDDVAASVLRADGARQAAASATGGAVAWMAAVGHDSFHSVIGDSWAIRTAQDMPATPAVVDAYQWITFQHDPSAPQVLHLTGDAS
ncbi:hypothetical protein [Cellulomonas sp. URHB0016]